MFILLQKQIQQPSKTKTIIVLITVTLLSHCTYIFNSFTWLDHIDLERQSAVISLTNPLTAFTQPYSATHFYRPLITLFHSLDYLIYNRNPYGFHATNLLIHSGVVVLTYLLITRIFKISNLAAVGGSLIVALHPVNALSIGSISYRTDPLAALFSLLTVLMYLSYKKTEKKRYIALSIVSFFCALCSKETSLLWVPLLFIISTLHPIQALRQRKNQALVGLYLACFSLFYLLRATTLNSLWQFKAPNLSFTEHLGTRASAFLVYLWYLIKPVHPPISDALAINSLFSLQTMFVLLILSVITITAYMIRHNPTAVTVIIVLILSILPGLNLIPLPRFISPHYLYFTTILLSCGGAYFLENYILNHKCKAAYLAATFIWLSLAVLVSLQSGGKYQNDYTLFFSEVDKDQRFNEGKFYLANYYLINNQTQKAINMYESMLVLQPTVIAFNDELSARINLSLLYIQQNKLTQAETLLNQTLAKINQAQKPSVVYNLALVKFAQNDSNSTIHLLNENKVYKQAQPQAGLLLAEAYLKNNDKKQAQQILIETLPFIQTEQFKQIFNYLIKQAID